VTEEHVLIGCKHDVLGNGLNGLYDTFGLLYDTANLSVLLGSFLVRILPYGPLPWKWS